MRAKQVLARQRFQNNLQAAKDKLKALDAKRQALQNSVNRRQ